MIYPENFESKIGFDRIRNQIAVLCITDGAREKLSGLHFSTSREEIVRLLEETFEMRTILMLESDFPENNYVDTALSSKKLKSREPSWRPAKSLRYARALPPPTNWCGSSAAIPEPNTRACGH